MPPRDAASAHVQAVGAGTWKQKAWSFGLILASAVSGATAAAADGHSAMPSPLRPDGPATPPDSHWVSGRSTPSSLADIDMSTAPAWASPTMALATATTARQLALQLRGGITRDQARAESRESLYEAYALLHALAKDFKKPIDAPAVLVVGHQTAGKSALVEALMGFQFNQVGGGTKTRRPVALNMKYNPACSQPACFLTNDEGFESRMSLAEIQDYIENENKRLEADPMRCFDHREINIRVEYRYCPNMIVIDTPGLISATKARGGGHHSANAQERALAQAAKEAENLVLNKMKCQEYIILCIEDSTDWKHASTRALVMQADPTLSRTVMVNTKLDTKLLQFGVAEDIQEFIEAPLMQKLYPKMLGGPFYTSVPCGRVGSSSTSEFRNNDEFVNNLRRRERADKAVLNSKLGISNAKPLLPRVGVRKLRSFLERRVEDCYRRNVASIVPLLQNELHETELQRSAAVTELESLSIDSLKKNANMFREHFARALAATIQGTISAPPGIYGETLESEQLRGGSFLGSVGETAGLSAEQWDIIVDRDVGNANARLFGGAQYHRALREFAIATQHMGLPEVTDDEIANAGGMNDVHDGTNFMRAACVIAVEKAQASFEPLLDALRIRTLHIMKRLYPVTEYMLENQGLGLQGSQNQAFTEVVHRIYEKFVDDTMAVCLERCKDDLRGMTRFVTWDLKERGSIAVQNSLPTTEMVEIYALAVKDRREKDGSKKKKGLEASKERAVITTQEEIDLDQAAVMQRRDSRDLLHLMEEVTCMRDTNRTCAVVSALVRHIVTAWRTSFAQNVAMKFNCFFLLPFLDEFPFILRTELDKLYDGDMSHLFDMREARAELERRVRDIELETKSNKKLQSKFEWLNTQLSASKSWETADTDAYPTATVMEEPLPEAEEGEVEEETPDDDSDADDGGAPFDDDVDFDGGEWGDTDLDFDDSDEISINHVKEKEKEGARKEVGKMKVEMEKEMEKEFFRGKNRRDHAYSNARKEVEEEKAYRREAAAAVTAATAAADYSNALDGAAEIDDELALLERQLDRIGTDWEDYEEEGEEDVHVHDINAKASFRAGSLPPARDEKAPNEGPATWQQGPIHREQHSRSIFRGRRNRNQKNQRN